MSFEEKLPMFKLLLWASLLAPTFLFAQEKPTVDFSGVDAFWDITAKVKKHTVTDADWDRLFSTGYYKFYVAWNQRKYMQRVLTMAFDPSMLRKRDSIMKTSLWSATVLKHLVATDSLKAEITAYREALEEKDIFGEASELASKYLPKNLIEKSKRRPDISFGLFQPDGNANSNSIVMDLNFARGVDIIAVIAHELHHFYTYNYRVKFNEVETSDNFGIIKAVTQLQLEGIADLIDKETPIDSSHPKSSLSEKHRLVLEDPFPALKKVDSLLTYISEHPESTRQNGLLIRDLLPLGGHPHGHHMARTILKTEGHAVLLSTLINPFDFIRAYNKAIAKASGTPAFSEKSLRFLAKVEEQERGM